MLIVNVLCVIVFGVNPNCTKYLKRYSPRTNKKCDFPVVWPNLETNFEILLNVNMFFNSSPIYMPCAVLSSTGDFGLCIKYMICG